MRSGGSSCSRLTSASIADGVLSVVHRSPLGCTAMTNVVLLTSIPTVVRSIESLLGVATPDLIRVRARGPVNCPGSPTPNAEERPSCRAVLRPGDKRATLPRGVLSDREDIRRLGVQEFLQKVRRSEDISFF